MLKSANMIVFCLVALAALAAVSFGAPCGTSEPESKGAVSSSKGSGWMLGTQAYTFRVFTLFEAIDKAKELGLHYMELYPGQTLSKEQSDVKFDHNLPVAMIAKVKNKLDDADVKAVGYGVVSLTKDEAECRKVFDFAKAMGITTITSEPAEDVLTLVDKLANEYQINVAIHNHPKPSHYWNPEIVLRAIAHCSKRIGSCADTGHWIRSGLDPLACLKQLEGRILWSHFKDLNEKSPKAHDVPWGTGIADAKALLAELKRQGFTGGIMAEYEHNWENSVPDLAKCVAFFNTTVKEIGPPEKRSCEMKNEKK